MQFQYYEKQVASTQFNCFLLYQHLFHCGIPAMAEHNPKSHGKTPTNYSVHGKVYIIKQWDAFTIHLVVNRKLKHQHQNV